MNDRKLVESNAFPKFAVIFSTAVLTTEVIRHGQNYFLVKSYVRYSIIRTVRGKDSRRRLSRAYLYE